MSKICRVLLLLILSAGLAACSTVQQALGPEKQQSSLRAEVEAPVSLSVKEDDFCVKPVQLSEKLELQVAPAVKTPDSYSLYFLLDQTVFTDESAARVESIYRDIVARKPQHIKLIGHTDTAASVQYNDDLSYRRAQKVKQDLVAYGLSPSVIGITADGEFNLEVYTPDDTVEVRNRRVEIILQQEQ